MKFVILLLLLASCSKDPLKNCLEKGVDCAKVPGDFDQQNNAYVTGCEKYRDIDSCLKLANSASILRKEKLEKKYLSIACDIGSAVACKNLDDLMQVLCYDYSHNHIYPEECAAFPPTMAKKIKIYMRSRGRKFSDVFDDFDFTKDIESPAVRRDFIWAVEYQKSWLLEALEQVLTHPKQTERSKVALQKLIEKMQVGSGKYVEVGKLKVPGKRGAQITLKKIKACDSEDCSPYHFIEIAFKDFKQHLTIENIDPIRKPRYKKLNEHLEALELKGSTYILVNESEAPHSHFHIIAIGAKGIQITSMLHEMFFEKIEYNENSVLAYFEGGHGEPGTNCRSYDPFLVYKQNETGKFILDEKLSQQWSESNNFKWHGPVYSEKICVDKTGAVIK